MVQDPLSPLIDVIIYHYMNVKPASSKLSGFFIYWLTSIYFTLKHRFSESSVSKCVPHKNSLRFTDHLHYKQFNKNSSLNNSINRYYF